MNSKVPAKVSLPGLVRYPSECGGSDALYDSSSGGSVRRLFLTTPSSSVIEHCE